ncbi:hypothetical protein BCR33DRAFT_435359 [Rhizoclosmatium globosum]|uniref:HCP-like protein n=1 Tax=Rhizoclosmatium globosum TaxID=329046 RepID=A0A1Y2BUD5_9FUNG|nr:hypothetical protein BCR33DRAFT_435359 [Rhizoclosmatium globosum]|eukprot:ORY38247.1 hypothetical protein BCR33DRAFT_435359 [Rhizoclosmatium globosum]
MKAAENNNPGGQVNLAYMYKNGLGGLRKDEVRAADWYKKGVLIGDAECINLLGLCYLKGLVFPRVILLRMDTSLKLPTKDTLRPTTILLSCIEMAMVFLRTSTKLFVCTSILCPRATLRVKMGLVDVYGRRWIAKRLWNGCWTLPKSSKPGTCRS